MQLKIPLLTFCWFLASTAQCTPITSKITTGKSTSQDAMTPPCPDDINKPPTGKFRRNPGSRGDREEENDRESWTIRTNAFDPEMLGDQPLNDDGFKTISVAPLDEIVDAKSYSEGPSDNRMISTTVDPAKSRKLDIESPNGLRSESASDRNQRLREIQNLIPVMTGRSNVSDAGENSNSTNIDISHLPPIEKIVFFAPDCNAPKVAKEAWKEESLLHLYFNVSYNTNATLASAIIKLHRVPREETQLITTNSNNNKSGEEEEKLLRVSIYWYSKYGKKQRSRKRLCDSKVVTDKQSSVELNVKPAVTSWLDAQNLGFAIKVENQEENVLKATNYFKGGCKSALGINSQPHQDASPKNLQTLLLLGTEMLPQISICTVENITGAPLLDKSITCQLHKTFLNSLEIEGNRKVQGLIGNVHHLRHQKHLEENSSRIENLFKKQHLHDVRNLIENKRQPSKDELDRLKAMVSR